MYNVKISKTLKYKPYFWYLWRCFKTLESDGIIKITEINSLFFEENYYETVFINDYPLFFDLRDDLNVSKKLSEYTKDYILLKSNFSTELWNQAKQGIYPDGLEYKLTDWQLDSMSHIRAFMHGRAFAMNHKVNELTKWNQYTQNNKFKVVSFSGAGLHKLQTENRLKVFELFNDVFKTNAKLMFIDRKHLILNDKLAIIDYNELVNKYSVNINTRGYENYIKFLSQGDYSINTAGLCLSTPFRFVDSVIANRCVISTKIYHDIYKNFPCIQLPICGYTGEGDWEGAKNILASITDLGYGKLLKKTKDWYSWFFSATGMFENQILHNLKGKI